jgi:hypothetical protein
MSRHLTDAELVDCLAGALAEERRHHVETCGTCRSRVDLLCATVEEVERAEPDGIPEPSPLFWDHFSRRVSEAIAEEPPLRRSTWTTAVILGAAACVLFVSMWVQNRSVSPPADAPVAQVESAPMAIDSDRPADLDGDIEWSLVQVAADDLEWDSVSDAGIGARPGSAERMAIEMSDAERRELERLIEAELKQMGA